LKRIRYKAEEDDLQKGANDGVQHQKGERGKMKGKGE